MSQEIVLKAGLRDWANIPCVYMCANVCVCVRMCVCTHAVGTDLLACTGKDLFSIFLNGKLLFAHSTITVVPSLSQ